MKKDILCTSSIVTLYWAIGSFAVGNIARCLYRLFSRDWGSDPKLEQNPKLKVSIDGLQLDSTTLKIKDKNQAMITVDAGTDCADGKVIRCNFKLGSEERSIDD
jgi:hypothetical protein